MRDGTLSPENHSFPAAYSRPQYVLAEDSLPHPRKLLVVSPRKDVFNGFPYCTSKVLSPREHSLYGKRQSLIILDMERGRLTEVVGFDGDIQSHRTVPIRHRTKGTQMSYIEYGTVVLKPGL